MIKASDITSINNDTISEDPHFQGLLDALHPIIIAPANTALMPSEWEALLFCIHECIDENKFIAKDDEGNEVIRVMAKFESEYGKGSVLFIKMLMAFKRDEKGVVIRAGELLVDIVSQVNKRSSSSELQKFNDIKFIEKYRKSGNKVYNAMTNSVTDPETLTTFFKHMLMQIQNSVINIDGVRTDVPVYLMQGENRLVAASVFRTERSDLAMSLKAGISAQSGDALLTTEMTSVCTTSSPDENGIVQILHITNNIKHVLSSTLDN